MDNDDSGIQSDLYVLNEMKLKEKYNEYMDITVHTDITLHTTAYDKE